MPPVSSGSSTLAAASSSPASFHRDGSRPCQRCGSDNPATHNFCHDCGATLAGPASTGERRHLTVLFSDLVASTALASTFDPEEWSEIVKQYHACVSDTVQRHGGHVAQYLGDGVLAYFGWPAAHGDDAERGVRAGLAIVEATQSLARRLGLPLPVRVGMETGAAVIDDRGLGYGDPFNVAARVQAIAEPDTVLITAATHRLVAGLFVVEDGGARALKGVAKPTTVYRVRAASGVRGRLAASAARGLTPFIGRDHERRLLLDRWEHARRGDGEVVVISGEPGIGKSRLLQQFRQDLGPTPHTWMESGGSPFFQNTPYHPIVDLLQQFVASGRDASVEGRLAVLETALAVTAMPLEEVIPLVAPLLGLPVPEKYAGLVVSPEQKQTKLPAALTSWVLAVARVQPLVIVVEDLQWIDESTAEVQRLLIEQSATVPLLLLFTTRAEFRPRWPRGANHTHLDLNRLSSTLVREMAARVAVNVPLSRELLEAVVVRTDGVPLFVEELTKAIVESGVGGTHEIPVTLHDSLMARLDRLGAAKDVAQIASVLGREFDYPMLAAVSSTAEPALGAALDRLVDADLLFVRGLLPEATYTFKHALVQDAAYGSLLKARRRELHRAAARVLRELFPARAAAQPEVLAHHHAQAGEALPAAAAWQEAGERALLSSAIEAAVHLQRGIDVLAPLPDDAVRAQQELALQLRLGQALQTTVGYGSAEVTAVFARTRELTDQLGTGSGDMFLLVLLWTNTFSRAELRGARQIAERLLALAVRDESRPARTWAHVTQACTRYHAGDFAGAHEHAERAIGLYVADEHHMPQDPGGSATVYAALASFQLGFADRARHHIGDALRLATRLDSPFNTVWTHFYDAFVAHHCRDVRRVLAVTETALAMAQEHHFQFFVGWGQIVRGWALAESGTSAEGLDLLREGIATLDGMSHRLSTSVRLAFLAHVLGLHGDLDSALRTIDDALDAVREERACRPELLHERAVLRAKAGAPADELEPAYRAALEAADELGARVWSLRSATALAGLLQRQDRTGEARDVLVPRYAWFTEGFDTRDLVEAKALVETLG